MPKGKCTHIMQIRCENHAGGLHFRVYSLIYKYSVMLTVILEYTNRWVVVNSK